MDRTSIERKIGDGVGLLTKTGKPFRVTVTDYGFEYEISTGSVRRTAWTHTSRPGGPGILELFRRWRAAGRPDATTWIPEQDGVGRRSSSYLLATFQFLTGDVAGPTLRASSKAAQWSYDDLRRNLNKFEEELRAAGLAETSIQTYVSRSDTFLRWLVGEYQPRGTPTG